MQGKAATMVAQKTRQFSLKSKMWLEIKGRPIIGEGRMAMLQAIDDNVYGICRRCEEAISIKRLKVRPVARYCIDCKTELEKILTRGTPSDHMLIRAGQQGVVLRKLI